MKNDKLNELAKWLGDQMKKLKSQMELSDIKVTRFGIAREIRPGYFNLLNGIRYTGNKESLMTAIYWLENGFYINEQYTDKFLDFKDNINEKLT